MHEPLTFFFFFFLVLGRGVGLGMWITGIVEEMLLILTYFKIAHPHTIAGWHDM